MPKPRALVVGLGIAGMATAVSLRKAGWDPVIVEKAAERRTGGYFIGLFPEGQDAARDLGVLDFIHTRDAKGRSWDQDAEGNRNRVTAFIEQPGSPKGVLRGDVEAGLWHAIEDDAEVRFATTPTELSPLADRVLVGLANSATGETSEEEFDLVVGADGLRSTVRRMAFGPHDDFLTSLNAMICAFEFQNQAPQYDSQDGVTVSAPGHALWIFPFSDRPPTALFTYRTTDVDAEFRRPYQDVLRERFANLHGDGVVQHALSELGRAGECLFDSVQQVRMDRWSNDRIVLVGDAAWCLTLYSGMGVTAGLKGGYELGQSLNTSGADIVGALAGWEDRMRPFVRKHQRLAYLKRELFVPSNRLTAGLRRGALRIIQRKAARTASAAQSAGYLARS